jgi:hypothetical protein
MKVLKEITFGKTSKPLVFLKKGKVYLEISYFRNSSVRIADSNGNHLYKPLEHKLESKYFLEWMITNKSIAILIREFFSNQEIKDIIVELNKINRYIEKQGEFTGRKIESDYSDIKEFEGFQIIPRSEKFFTFKKNITDTSSFVEVTFKPGDVSPMEEHMYMLISFSKLDFACNSTSLSPGDNISRPCLAIWEPTKEEIKEIVLAIGHTSLKHKDQVVEEILRS